MTIQHKWRCYKKLWKFQITKVRNLWNLLGKYLLWSFIHLVKLQTYSVQTTAAVKKTSPEDFCLEYISKTSCFKKNILRGNSMQDQRFTKFRPCSTQSPFLSKTELLSDFSLEVLQNSSKFTRKPRSWRLLFNKVACLGFILPVSSRKGSTTKASARYFCQAFPNKFRI